jgi:hypothetical protein
MTRRSITTNIALCGAVVLAAVGCGDEGGRGSGADGPGLTSLTGMDGTEGGIDDVGGTAAEGDATAGGADDDGLDSADGSPSFDLGGAEAGDGFMPEEGCQAVDFLFVIDNSVSMENNQAALVGAFPGFMAAIDAALETDSDYHIMAVDTDEWGRCDTANPWNGMDAGSDTCNNYVKTTAFDECDRTRGGGVVHPAGQHATNAMCTFMGGNRYIVAGEPDLAGAFSCAATVGVAGHPSERPMDSMVAALQPAINAAGGCNDGFLRPDALLVIAFVSDDPNLEDTDGPDEWYDAVVQAKGGDPSAVVVMGLTPNWPDCGNANNINGTHWTEFIGKWGDHGLHGNVCGTAEEYVSFFEMAVSTIDQACDDFVPPG